MATIRSYEKTESAYLDAAFLGSMGVDVRVIDARGEGGRAVGITEPVIKLEVPDDQAKEAIEWLAKQEKAEVPVYTPAFDPTWNTDDLQVFLKVLLVCNLGYYALLVLYGQLFAPSPPPEVAAFLDSLSFSDDLWDFAYISNWPLVSLSVLANVLCLFQSKTGRLLFAVCTIWGLITALGPPPQIFGPWWNFICCLAFTGNNIALALMYWSPLRQKFDRKSEPGAMKQ
ncbi:MAG: hypothetical protein J0L73_06185 [Verrucomicrobia bacterium]|nr:hypothetical protein [Verrucomicrobiota bacterium]